MIKKEKILLGILPYWDPMIPPLGITRIKDFLQEYGYEVKTVDLIVKKESLDIYNQYFNVLKQCIPVSNQGNFYNIGHDVLQNHMMAHIRYRDEAKYIKLLKLLIFNTYYVEAANEWVYRLKELMDNFYRWLKECFFHILAEEKPGILGLTVYKGTLPASLFIFEQTRQHYPHIRTVMGGGVFADTHAAGTPNFDILVEMTNDYVDKIIVGQGEKLFLKYLEGQLPRSQRVYTLADISGEALDSSPGKIRFPDFSDLDTGNYPYLGASGSTGCQYQCGFCNSLAFFGTYRKKNPRQIVEEMIMMYKTYGHQLFFMTDSMLNPIVTDLAREFINRGVSLYYDAYFRVDDASRDTENTLLWRQGGLYRVRLGVESGSQKILDAMNKKITVDMTRAAMVSLAYAGIKTTAYLVVGYPGETEADFQETLKLIEELQNDIFQAECNPFLYHFSGQSASDSWADKRETLYPDEMDDMLVFKTWSLDIPPSREETYDRLYRLVNQCKLLGIPNPYSLNQHYKADERWKKLHKNAAPSLIAFRNKENYIDENQGVKKLHFLKNRREEAHEFGF
jgi:hypothetical protein